MKKKTLILALLAMILGICLVATAEEGESEDLTAPEDGLVIDYVKGNSPRGLSVEFNHSSHGDYDCNSCHHKMFQLKQGEQPRSCATCHTKFDVNDTTTYKSYFKAMHRIRQAPQSTRPSCVACHTAEFENDTEMTGCTASACHGQGLY